MPDSTASFQPRNLRPDQVAELYQQALTQAEATAQNAWMNHILNPHDQTLLAAYRESAEKLRRLEEDRDRVCRQPG